MRSGSRLGAADRVVSCLDLRGRVGEGMLPGSAEDEPAGECDRPRLGHDVQADPGGRALQGWLSAVLRRGTGPSGSRRTPSVRDGRGSARCRSRLPWGCRSHTTGGNCMHDSHNSLLSGSSGHVRNNLARCDGGAGQPRRRAESRGAPRCPTAPVARRPALPRARGAQGEAGPHRRSRMGLVTRCHPDPVTPRAGLQCGAAVRRTG